MSSDDSLAWLFKQITEVARTVGQARRELDSAMKGIMDPASFVAPTTQQQLRPVSPHTQVANPVPVAHPSPDPDPLVIAARNEGIVTNGKTREQIATELAIKLNNAKP